jgi:glycine cleavage system transcriptional repressor
MNKVILSVLGNDRPGIVAAVAKILFELNCNIENVSQTTLQNEFAGIFIISLPNDLSLEVLQNALDTGLNFLNLQAYVKPLVEKEAPWTSTQVQKFIITTKGPDRKGLVAGISAIIAKHGVNITNLQAVFKGGNDPDSNLMIYEVDIPADIDQHALYQDLREKAASFALDITMQHRNIFEAINRI